MFASTQSEICTDSFSATVRLLRGDQARHGIDSLNELSRTGAPRVICTGLSLIVASLFSSDVAREHLAPVRRDGARKSCFSGQNGNPVGNFEHKLAVDGSPGIE
jgi:hypothetical protein